MKKILIIILSVLVSTSSFAQNPACVKGDLTLTKKGKNLEWSLQSPSKFIQWLLIKSDLSHCSQKDQHERPGSYSPSDYSRIPYFELEIEDGVEYIFDYTKTNLNNEIVFQKQGKLVIQDGRAILP